MSKGGKSWHTLMTLRQVTELLRVDWERRGHTLKSVKFRWGQKPFGVVCELEKQVTKGQETGHK